MRFAAPSILIAVLLLSGCGRGEPDAPPRLESESRIPVSTSVVRAPLVAELSALEAIIEREMPATLWTIDQQEDACVPAQHVTLCLAHARACEGDGCKDVPCKVGVKKGKITPDISCRIVGSVTRGKIRLSGDGELIRITMPVAADVAARDIGNVLSATGTANAEVRATVRLSMSPDWQPSAKVEIDYDWTRQPGIELLGRRITFADKADPKLRALLDKLEQRLPQEIAKLHPKAELERLWTSAFTSLELNRRNPPVWMRLTPQRLNYGGYSVEDGKLLLQLELEADAETFVGDRPEDPAPVPLPDSGPISETHGFVVTAPVIAQYEELEPVLQKALAKLEVKGIDAPGVGRLYPRFGKPTVYATQGGRLALGLSIAVTTLDGAYDAKGIVWLTGEPWNEPNSPVVKVRNLVVDAETNRLAADILLTVANTPDVRMQIEEALAQNFARDLEKLKVKINRALTDKRLGDFILNAEVDELRYGVVQALGQGAYLPVEVRGTGSVELAPRPGN